MLSSCLPVLHYHVNYRIILESFFIATLLQSINLLNIVLIVWYIPQDTLNSLRQRIVKLLGKDENKDTNEIFSFDRFVLIVSIWVTLLAAFLSFFIYECHPHVPDEVIYLYHARCLAAGTLTVPAPTGSRSIQLLHDTL